MKVVISQVNVGSKFRFMPSGVSSSLSNYPRDGWLTEAAARKWAKANGHEIVKVEKVAGNGEKIHRIEYTYKDRFGKTKKQTSEFVGKDVEPLKKRIVEGLERNGDKLVSFGRITSKDSVDLVDMIKEKYQADAVEYSQDKLLITANGFGNEKGVSKKDPRNGLKPFEVNFYIKGKDGKLFKTGRSKMAASLNEAKQWANSESRKYKNVAKVEVKEFRDSVDSADSVGSIREKYANDAAFGIKIPDNEKGSQRLTMEKVFKELSPPAAWKKVKKGNTIIIKYVGQGPVKGKDVLRIEYFNPNVVAMIPRNGSASMVGLNRVGVMVSKLGMEGWRSYQDSVDAVDEIREKYQSDAVGAGVVNPNFKFSTNVEKRLATTRRGSGRVMTLPQYGKPSKVIVKKDGNSFSVIGKDGQKLNKNTFKSYEEAEKWARGNGWMVERR